MKTVQLLYSYLLVEKPFSLESQPSSPTKEKRFAYYLYLEMIYLIIRLAHKVKGKNKNYPLQETRFVIRTESEDKMKSLKIKYEGIEFPFSKIEDQLTEAIKDSLLFKEFEKNKQENINSEDFWENIFKSIIITNPQVNEIIKTLAGYSLSGEERMKLMMETTFSNFYATRDNIDDALKTLELSMQKARDLYMRLLAIPVEITKLRLEQLTQNKNKYLATVEDLNPNMRFVNNLVPKEIENNKDFKEYIEKNHISWLSEDPELLEILLKAIMDSEIYIKYEKELNSDINKDADFWIDIYTNIILNNQDFLEYLENKSVFWNDNLEIMVSFVIKSLKRLSNPDTSSTAVLPMYKDGIDGKDAKFGAQLFKYVVLNKDIYRKYIEDALSHDKWDADRLAFMDLVITMTALAEIINYPEIPLQVSINEYIEIAKSYSSEKSGQFVNGLIASILPKLKEEGILKFKS